MSLSRRIIKNNQVDMMTDSLEIPLSSIKLVKSRERKPGVEEKAEESARQVKAKLDEMIKQAELQSEELIHQSEERADVIKIQAKEEGYKAGLQEGRQSGYQAGYQAGHDEAVQNAKEMKEQAKALLNASHRESREYISETSSEIIELAATMAKKIIHLNIDIKDESIVEMVKVALRQSEDKKQIIMRSPEKFVTTLQANAYQFEKICPNASFVFLEDPTIASPGCVIETDDQVIDLEVDKQLDNIVNALRMIEKC